MPAIYGDWNLKCVYKCTNIGNNLPLGSVGYWTNNEFNNEFFYSNYLFIISVNFKNV